jgi:Holliday junction resolvase RusA-like endonuclease
MMIPGLPPSANKLGRHNSKGKTFLDPVVREYKQRIGRSAAEIMPLEYRTQQFFAIKFTLFAPHLKYEKGLGHRMSGNAMDVDNTLKIAIDAIFQGCGMNDRTVRDLTLSYEYYPHEFTKIELYPIEVSSMTNHYTNQFFDVKITSACTYCGLCDSVSKGSISFADVVPLEDYRKALFSEEKRAKKEAGVNKLLVEELLSKVKIDNPRIEVAEELEALCPVKAFKLTKHGGSI